jgi:bifunctional UDP-N-acetylglucosamine pyrophosphorylase/glucosamine-1-phosphate N-acetyltransferase
MDSWLRKVDDGYEQRISPPLWTAIIPAAGKGTRLEYDKPKILFPIAGRPISDWLIDALESLCERFVFVVSANGSGVINAAVRPRLGNRVALAVQATPNGMGDAILKAEPFTNSRFSTVIWGDQVTLRRQTIAKCMSWHEAREKPTLTLPTIIRSAPYIDIERDNEGRIRRVRQAREGEIERTRGENDCGLFCFTTSILFAELRHASSSTHGLGRSTGEINLLQILPLFEQGAGSVGTLRISDISETLGVNTRQDALDAERVLSGRATHSC